jgi:hypothetical protein
MAGGENLLQLKDTTLITRSKKLYLNNLPGRN